MKPVSTVYSCICPLAWCVPSIQSSVLHIQALNKCLLNQWADFFFILHSNSWTCPYYSLRAGITPRHHPMLSARERFPKTLEWKTSILCLEAGRVCLVPQSFVLSLECLGRTSSCGFVTGARESQNAVG